jgi:PPOX class probable F420-dependent enzyme
MQPSLLSPACAEFLERARVGHLATVDGDCAPNVLPVCFAMYGGCIYIAVDEKPKRKSPTSLRRVRNILGNARVCFVADRYDDEWRHLAWVQVHGEATLVSDPGEREQALAALRRRYPQYLGMDLESRPLIRVMSRRVNAWSIDGSL